MKYATAKEFMQNLPGVMYVNLDTATDRPYVKNYSEEIEIRNFISDPQLAQQVIEKIRKEDERRLGKALDTQKFNDDNEMFTVDATEEILQQFMEKDCNIIVIHETLNFFDNGIADPDQYEDMDSCDLAISIANRLKMAMQVNVVRAVYRTQENIGNDIFYIITTSIDAVTTINTKAAEEFISAEGTLSSFYESLMYVNWYAYNLDDIANDEIYGDIDDEESEAWTNYDTKHYTNADMMVDKVVDRFCRYISLRLYSDIRSNNLKHFTRSTLNYILLHQIIGTSADKLGDNMMEMEKALTNARLYPDFRWVLKQFRKVAYLDGTGKEISTYLKKIYDVINSISIGIDVLVTCEYVPIEYIDPTEEQLIKLDGDVEDAALSIFDDLVYGDDPDDDDDDDYDEDDDD